MLIRVGYEMAFQCAQPTPIIALLHLHPSIDPRVRRPERFETSPRVPVTEFVDSFGNRCSRLLAPNGYISLRNDAVVEDSGEQDPQVWTAPQANVEDLPHEVLLFLLASRYCEVDSELKDLAGSLFNATQPGWPRVQAICNFVFQHIHFDYMQAQANRTALEVFRGRQGVCRDYTHLAVTLCRCMNIPARYCTGYLSDIGAPPTTAPMDFSAWFEAYLGGQWHVFDPRNNVPRVGRILMARGRDAADAALTTTYGENQLATFRVWTDPVAEDQSNARMR